MKAALIIEDRVAEIPVVEADVACTGAKGRGEGRLKIANDVNNPIVIESRMKFSWERTQRMERVTRVIAGLGMHRDMEQSLQTLGTYDVYGLHFDFSRSALRRETEQLVRDIALMLQGNPNSVIQIAGHPDSIGGAASNSRLSLERAEAVRHALFSPRLSASSRARSAS